MSAQTTPGSPGVPELARRVLLPRRPSPQVLRLAAGLLVLVATTAWSVLAWAGAVRTVDVDRLQLDLAQGRVVAATLVEDVREDGGGFGSRLWDSTTWTVHGDGAPDGGGTALVYRTTDLVGPLRLVDVRATSGPEALLAEVRSRTGGVSSQVGDPDPVRGVLPALVALGVLGLVVAGPPPRWGTRWFWFWVCGAAVPLGVWAFAVLELVTRRRHHPEGLRRLGGWAGFGLGFVLSVAVPLVGAGVRRLLGAGVSF
ncbi:hypothetical protein LG324_19105 [Phycicoccus jejuensis]|uniref:hypothetical protein n=1 Tax=Phycicoccus jejuensis TaxID=367299 RepID=UPI00384D5418